MLVTETGLPGVMLMRPVRHCDPRGFFAELFREDVFARQGITFRRTTPAQIAPMSCGGCIFKSRL